MQELSNVIAGKYEEIIEKIKSFSDEYLNEEYKNICVAAAETLCLNNEEVIKKGKSFSWAAGIVHAIGTVNNLFDAKEQPYIKALDLYKEFGVSNSTATNKSKEVKKLLNLSKENMRWIIGAEGNTPKEEVAVTTEAVNAKFKDQPLKVIIDKNFVIAQRIINYAWHEKNYKNKAKFAKEALKIYENCPDAYIILSKDSKLNDNEKKELLEKAVKAGQHMLKIENLENADLQVLSLKVSEPFFGAKYTLAMHLWRMNQREEAIQNAFDVVKYDKKDNLLVRGILSSWLLIEEKYDQAKELLEKYETDYLAHINYNRVALFYKTGKLKEAESALRRAYKRNPFVIEYLLKQKRVPSVIPSIPKIGNEAEAMVYANLGLQVWNDSQMVNWLKEMKRDFDIINFK